MGQGQPVSEDNASGPPESNVLLYCKMHCSKLHMSCMYCSALRDRFSLAKYPQEGGISITEGMGDYRALNSPASHFPPNAPIQSSSQAVFTSLFQGSGPVYSPEGDLKGRRGDAS